MLSKVQDNICTVKTSNTAGSGLAGAANHVCLLRSGSKALCYTTMAVTNPLLQQSILRMPRIAQAVSPRRNAD